MDRRKVQVQNKADEITEEKTLLLQNLDKIVYQINLSADHVNNSHVLKQKDCSLILKYQLEVLKKLTEINFELESIIEDSPLTELNISNDFNSDNVYLEPKKENVSNGPSETEEIVQPSQEFELSDATAVVQTVECSSLDVETQKCSPDADIQSLRQTLKKFSEKLGINPENISFMTNFYQKPLENFEEPSISPIVQFVENSINADIQNDVEGNASEILDEEARETVTYECEFKSENIEPTECFSENTSIVEVSTVHDTNTSECNQAVIPNKMENVFSTDISSTNSAEDSSGEELTNEIFSNCQQSPVDERTSSEEVVNKNNNDKEKETNKIVYTALEKLNNTKFSNLQAETAAKLALANKPDISLKPVEVRIKNCFSKNGKSRKKKNKNKCKDTEIYELKPKAPPEAGMECAFSHVESPADFYIHLVDEECAQIDNLTDMLNAMFDGSESEYSSKEEAYYAMGVFCVAYVPSYNSWYRVNVLDWEIESKSADILVQLVDYGDKRRISFKNLRKLTKDTTEIPMLAIRCHLALMYPPSSTILKKLTEWPPATIDAMMELSRLLVQEEEKRNKVFTIVYADQQGESVAIDMYNQHEFNEERTVGQILLDLGLAVQLIEEYDESNQDLEYFLQDVDCLEQADNINEAVMGYDPRDEARICRFTKRDGTCYKGKNCKLEHIPLSKDGFTTDKIPVFKEAMYSLELPGKDKLINILITGFKDVCNFFAQIVRNPHKEKDYMLDEDLYNLLAQMNVTSAVRTYETFKLPPSLGEIVIVKHWSDKWMRAVVREEIVSYTNDGLERYSYQVFTVDFGDYLTVPLSDLRKIKPHFLELPFQVVACYLHNYVAREDCDRKSAKKFFLENFYYRNFVGSTMSSTLPLKLSVTTFDTRHIGKMLVDKGFAKERVCDKDIIDGCYLELN